jgi:hypothetical protein
LPEEPVLGGQACRRRLSGDVHRELKRVPPDSPDTTYEVLEVFPGSYDTSIYAEVEGADLGYEEEYLEHGKVIARYVYCLQGVDRAIQGQARNPNLLLGIERNLIKVAHESFEFI